MVVQFGVAGEALYILCSLRSPFCASTHRRPSGYVR